MQSRFAFARLVLRHGVPAVRFAIPDRDAVEGRYALLKAGVLTKTAEGKIPEPRVAHQQMC